MRENIMYYTFSDSRLFSDRKLSSMPRACPSSVIFWFGHHIQLRKHVIEPEAWINHLQSLQNPQTHLSVLASRDIVKITLIHGFHRFLGLSHVSPLEYGVRTKILRCWDTLSAAFSPKAAWNEKMCNTQYFHAFLSITNCE